MGRKYITNFLFLKISFLSRPWITYILVWGLEELAGLYFNNGFKIVKIVQRSWQEWRLSHAYQTTTSAKKLFVIIELIQQPPQSLPCRQCIVPEEVVQ